jgi:ADP-ribose pyrophosphatase YjhB (NUDIX family)
MEGSPMRISEAGLACITRVGPNGDVEYLTQWSETWKMFSLIGGHVEPGESYRECVTREIEEELTLSQDEFRVGESLGRIEYEAFSQGSRQMTQYRVELFAVTVLGKVSESPTNRWLKVGEIEKKLTFDALPISEQVHRVLKTFFRGDAENKG